MANPALCGICQNQVDSSSYCSGCGHNFCDRCWSVQIAHRPGSVADPPHERSDPEITKRLQGILTPSKNPDTQKQLHLEDSETTWLRYVRAGLPQEPELEEDARYKKLMQDSFTLEWMERWPHLVSFIGQTGDGKSTIIKMLIELQKISGGHSTDDMPTPVVGSLGTSIPTSADIHLYADPESQYTQFPRIYADCEGLTGGEKTPMAHRAAEVIMSHNEFKKDLRLDVEYSKKLQQRAQAAQRRKFGFAHSEETRKREYVVREFYPRLLYTFSHVVVFVLHNERTFESGFVRLLEWAATSIESATNQSVLPHAIIVLNKCPILLKDEDFDIDVATERLLSDADQTLVVNHDVARLVRRWQGLRNVTYAKDLIKCYYSSFKVVRVPERGRYKLMNQQIKRLQDQISFCCQGSHEGKFLARRDLNADELGECLQSGLDHFTSSLEVPFDFLAFSWSRNPIPSGFEGNILRLALEIKSRRSTFQGEDIFKLMSGMVASCIMLDFVRFRVKGTASELLKHYEPVLNNVLNNFCDRWWPCNYTDKHGKKCINTMEGHVKGHQDERGRFFGSGVYQSNFLAHSYRPKWLAQIQKILLEIEKRMKYNYPVNLPHHQASEEKEAAKLHLHRMNDFYGSLGGAWGFQSNLSCFCCLQDMPEHPLPCEHVICSPCVRTFGEQISKTSFVLTKCPLHQQNSWDGLVKISLKPHLAGVRVLSLDGGGIRGIVELMVLSAIERELGGKIPIQDFFDLIVGTSTGGIIALGIGAENWSVSYCTDRFKSLCGAAFGEREFSGIPILEQLAIANHQSKYKTIPFERALKNLFGPDLLFGRLSHSDQYTRNVAVTTTTGVGTEPRILTNYNRPQADKCEYLLERPEQKSRELKTWQAARATSAAPPYFKPLKLERSGREYIDGALYHNNPVRVADAERKYLWPDVQHLEPDILLSIGTGKNSEHLEEETKKLQKQRSEKWWSKFVPKLFKIALARMQDILDSENTWRQFINSVSPSSSSRYLRINPELASEPPELDDKDALLNLEAEVGRSLDSMKREVRLVADQLVASCFYFEKATVQLLETQTTGKICCRFEDGSDNIRKLGHHLRSFQRESFAPCFIVVEEFFETHHIDTIVLTEPTIDRMVNYAKFDVDEPTIRIFSQNARTIIALALRPDSGSALGPLSPIPISGFPRQLTRDDEITPSRRNFEREAIRRTQSHYVLNSPSKSYQRDSSGSMDNSLSRVDLPRHSQDSSTRPSSVPGSWPPDPAGEEALYTPDEASTWLNRQSISRPTELEDTQIPELP